MPDNFMTVLFTSYSSSQLLFSTRNGMILLLSTAHPAPHDKIREMLTIIVENIVAIIHNNAPLKVKSNVKVQ